MRDLIPFSANDELYNASGSVESNCNGITFINLGQSVCTVMSVPLTQNQSLTIPCNIGEIDVTNYRIQFDSNQDKKLVVIRKNYNV